MEKSWQKIIAGSVKKKLMNKKTNISMVWFIKELSWIVIFETASINFNKIGTVIGKDIVIDTTNYGSVVDYKHSFDTSIESYLN